MTRASLGYDFLPLANPFTLQPASAKDYLDSIGRSKEEFFKVMQRASPEFAKNQIESARVELKIILGLLDICKKYFPDAATRTHDIGIADNVSKKLHGEEPVGFAEGYAQNAGNLENTISEMQARFDVAGLPQKTAALEFKLDFDANEINLFDFEIGSPKREKRNWEFTNRIFNLKHELHEAAWQAKTKELRADLFALVKNSYEPIETNFKIYKQTGSLSDLPPDYQANTQYVSKLIEKAGKSLFRKNTIKEIRRQLEAAKLEGQVLTQVIGVCSEFNLEEEGQELAQRLDMLNITSVALERALADAGLLGAVGQAELESRYLRPVKASGGFMENACALLHALMVAKAENIYKKPELSAKLDMIIKEYYSGVVAGFDAYFKEWSQIFAEAAKGGSSMREWKASGLSGAVKSLAKEWEQTKEKLHADGIITDAEAKELKEK